MGVNTADTFWLSALGLLGLVLGVFLFFRGFKMLQYKRLILNTPFSKIRSASMGLVEVSGTPTGPKTIASAITGSPCYYYRARGWQWINSGKGGQWQETIDESVFVPFFLDDGTGRVLVNAQGAELDVHRSFYEEFATPSLRRDAPIPESIRKFVALHGLAAGDKVRLEEHIIKPGFPLFVFGTLGENTLVSSWNPQRHAGGRKVSFSLNFGSSSTTMSDVAGRLLAGLIADAPNARTRTFTFTTGSEGAMPELPSEVVEALQRARISGQPGGRTPWTKVAVSGNTRTMVTQLDGAVLPQSDANLPSTSATVLPEPANTSADDPASSFDLHARAAVGKGERGDPFTISSRSQREVVQTLGWKAITCIWGGPIFALICLYCLLTFWGWM